MKPQMIEFSKVVKTAKETIADLSNQLKTTQEQALEAERQNSEYCREIAKLTMELRGEQERYKELEATAAEHATDNPPNRTALRQRLDQNNSEDNQLASQHDNDNTMDMEAVEKAAQGNEDQLANNLYTSEDNPDSGMGVNMSSNGWHRNTGKVG